MEINLFENYPNHKINFEEKWQSAEWINLETHTQILSKQKFTSFLLKNLQIRNNSVDNFLFDNNENKKSFNKNSDIINQKLIFNQVY